MSAPTPPPDHASVLERMMARLSMNHLLNRDEVDALNSVIAADAAEKLFANPVRATAPQPVPGTNGAWPDAVVAPLEWRDYTYEGDVLWESRPVWGHESWTIRHVPEHGWPWLLKPFINEGSNYQSLSDAMEAAEREHRRRVLLLLGPCPSLPTPDQQRAREAEVARQAAEAMREAIASHLRQQAEDHVHEHHSYDSSTGAWEGSPASEEWVADREELADELASFPLPDPLFVLPATGGQMEPAEIMQRREGWLSPIAPDARKGKGPCGECHIRPGETCDICGAYQPAPPAGTAP